MTPEPGRFIRLTHGLLQFGRADGFLEPLGEVLSWPVTREPLLRMWLQGRVPLRVPPVFRRDPEPLGEVLNGLARRRLLQFGCRDGFLYGFLFCSVATANRWARSSAAWGIDNRRVWAQRSRTLPLAPHEASKH
jgi:hypothetical protein